MYLVLITVSPTICLYCYCLIFFFLRHCLLTSHYGKCWFSSLSFSCPMHMHPSLFPSSQHNHSFASINIQCLQYYDHVSYSGLSLYSKLWFLFLFWMVFFFFPGVNYLSLVCIRYPMYLYQFHPKLSKVYPHFLSFMSDILAIHLLEVVFPWPLNCW